MRERFTSPKPSVMELVAKRAQRLQEGKKINDPYKLDLVIPGGGVGAIGLAGMLKALNEAGATATVFNTIRTLSAGSLIGAYYAAGQVDEGFRIYTEYINKKFINFLRPFRGGPIIDVNYITDDVMRNKVPLRWKKVIKKRGFLPYATSLTGELTDLRNIFTQKKFRKQNDVLSSIYSSASPPGTGDWNKKPAPDGNPYEDGGLAAKGIPPWKNEKTTHVMVLLPRPVRSRRSFSLLDQIGGLIYLARGRPELARQIRRFEKDLHSHVKELYAEQNNPNSPWEIEIVQLPARYKILGTLARKRSVLLERAEAGYDIMKDKLKPYFPNRHLVFQLKHA